MKASITPETVAKTGPFAAYWRRAIGLRNAVDPAIAIEAVGRLTPWIGHGLARAPVAAIVPENPVEAQVAAFQHLALTRQSSIVDSLRAGGLRFMPIGGYAAARLYEPAWARIVGDLDLLLRPTDVDVAIGELGLQGFSIERSPGPRSVAARDGEAHSFTSADGLVKVKLHTSIGPPPLGGVLPIETIFASATGDAMLSRLAPHHAAALAVASLARDRFAPAALRFLLDLGRLSVHETVDWPAADDVIAAAGLTPARTTALGALRRLGVPAGRLPAGLEPRPGPAADLARALGHLRLEVPGVLAAVFRDAVWGYDPGTVARLWWQRASGFGRRPDRA